MPSSLINAQLRVAMHIPVTGANPTTSDHSFGNLYFNWPKLFSSSHIPDTQVSRTRERVGQKRERRYVLGHGSWQPTHTRRTKRAL